MPATPTLCRTVLTLWQSVVAVELGNKEIGRSSTASSRFKPKREKRYRCAFCAVGFMGLTIASFLFFVLIFDAARLRPFYGILVRRDTFIVLTL